MKQLRTRRPRRCHGYVPQGTYTFPTLLPVSGSSGVSLSYSAAFRSFSRRRLKRRQDERLREQNLRALELEPLSLRAAWQEPPGLAPPPPSPRPS